MLNKNELAIIERARQAGANFNECEYDVINVLIEMEKLKLSRKVGKSLFAFAETEMKLSRFYAQMYIRIARATIKVPSLRKLEPAKAYRLASVIQEENAEELIAFAEKHTVRQIEAEVVKRNPAAANQDRWKYLSEKFGELRVTISVDTFEKLKRAETIKTTGWANVLDAALTEFLFKHDPLAKARRNAGKEIRLIKSDGGRRPLPAQIKHQVILRDEGCCTATNADGNRCRESRWTEFHHIVPVSQGGEDTVENITILCGFHHKALHAASTG